MWSYYIYKLTYILDKQVSLKIELNFLKITYGGGGESVGISNKDWRLKQDTDYTGGEISDKMKTAFQPVVVSKSSKSLQLSYFA